MENKPQMREGVTGSGKTASRRTLTRDAVVASICGFVVVLMVGASYAAVPFYNWFCRATGFNGTTQVATSAPAEGPLARKIAVRFDSNVAPGLPWKFEPEQSEIEVNIGQVVTVFYTAPNQPGRTTRGGVLLPEEQPLLRPRAEHGARREARDAGRVLRRSVDRRRPRERRAQH